MNDPIVIVSAARTPMGSFQGVFGAVSAPQLGAVAIKAAVGRAGVDAALVGVLAKGQVACNVALRPRGCNCCPPR